MKPEILDRRVAYSGYFTVETLRIRLADGFVVSRDVERHGDAAAVLPYDCARRCALVGRLFRAPVFDTTGEDSVEEACAGMIDHETDEAAAGREAGEELGVSLNALERVARVWSSPGVSTERQSLFLAAYSAVDRTAEGGGVPGEHEGIAVIERPLIHLARDLDQGRIVDGKLVTLVYALRYRRPDLFMALEPALRHNLGSCD
jgi:nudix-type nucleoside diphosphatase (YffH/AdpP family)